MKTNRLLFIATLMTAAGMNACTPEVTSTSNFETLCVTSGGTLIKSNSCRCGKTECESGIICNAQGGCADTGLYFCRVGDFKCENSLFYKCEGLSDNTEETQIGVWSLYASACDEYCEAGQTKCEDEIYYSCKQESSLEPGAWQKESRECPNYLLCDHEMVQCENDDQELGILRTCIKANDSTLSSSDTYIAILKTCGGNSCKIKAKEDNEQDSDSTQAPDSNQDSNPNEETNTEIMPKPIEMECGECRNGETKCVDDPVTRTGKLQTCIDGVWGEPINCTNNLIAVSCQDSTSCGECNNANLSYPCDLITNEYKLCNRGKWLPQPYICENGCNATGTKCVECEGNDTVCQDGELRTCKNGLWDTIEKCTSHLCMSATECAKCHFNETSFDQACTTIDGTQGEYICNQGEWQLTKECSCNGSKCDNTCPNGTMKCNSSNSIITCQDGQWGNIEQCQPSMYCSESAGNAKCVEKCNNGEKHCSNNSLSTCTENGEYQTAPCQYGCNKDGTDCAECNTGETQCTGRAYRICVEGKWREQKECALGCDSAGKVCKGCQKGQKSCLNDANGIGILTECKDEKNERHNCHDDASCNASNSNCGECQNGKTKCEKGMIKTCISGKWQDDHACPNGFSCAEDSMTCGECNNGAHCDTIAGFQAMKICNQGKWSSETYICDEKDKTCPKTGKCQNIVKVSERIISGATNRLRIRDDINGMVVDYFNNYTKIKVYGEPRDGWYRVDHNGKAGYIFGQFTTSLDNDEEAQKIIHESEKYLYSTHPQCCTADFAHQRCQPKLKNFSTKLNWTNCQYGLNSENFIRATLKTLGLAPNNGESSLTADNFINWVCEKKDGNPVIFSDFRKLKTGDIVWNDAKNRFAFVVGPRFRTDNTVAGACLLGSLDFFTNITNPCKSTCANWEFQNYQRVTYEDSETLLSSGYMRFACHRRK